MLFQYFLQVCYFYFDEITACQDLTRIYLIHFIKYFYTNDRRVIQPTGQLVAVADHCSFSQPNCKLLGHVTAKTGNQ